MSRFSLSIAMAVIALAAANFAAFRVLLPSLINGQFPGIRYVGLFPLANAQIIGVYMVASRYRIAVRRPTWEERIGFAPAFVVANALALLSSVVACLLAERELRKYLYFSLHPVALLFRTLGLQPSVYDNPFFQATINPLCLGAVLSGPPLLLNLTLSWLSIRYRLDIAARPRPGSGSIRVNAESGETQSDHNTA